MPRRGGRASSKSVRIGALAAVRRLDGIPHSGDARPSRPAYPDDVGAVWTSGFLARKGDAVMTPYTSRFNVERMVLASGDELFRDGDARAATYLIESGRIRLCGRDQEGEVEIGACAAGDVLSKAALLNRLPGITTATAEGETVLVPLPEHLLMIQLERTGQLVRRLVESYSPSRPARQRAH
jgi:hypothetical protein